MLRNIVTDLEVIGNSGYDVVGVADFKKCMNMGLVYTRSTADTVELARRVHNRTQQGWDQGLWNEELNAKADRIRCCATRSKEP